MMEIIVYYEGSDAIRQWMSELLGRDDCKFKKIPSSNNSAAFAQLPSYVADILYLDKPDIIISGIADGVHERPIFAIELATCTPQYQHSIQRFSRSLAAVTSGCPSVLIIPRRKRANDGGNIYNRSAAVDYGAVRLLDVFKVPALVVDWPEQDGQLLKHGHDDLPPLDSPNISELAIYLRQAINAFLQLDYLGALQRLPLTQKLVDLTRTRAYAQGAPSIENPGGGTGVSKAKLDLIDTDELIHRLLAENRANNVSISQIPDYFRKREKSLLFYPTRITDKAGDPYVGMLTYYDIAFCRTGPSTRDRRYNLVAYCNGVPTDEMTSKMKNFNNTACPFNLGLSSSNTLSYSYHLRDGCRKTKTKPVRIYSEIADLTAYTNGILVNP